MLQICFPPGGAESLPLLYSSLLSSTGDGKGWKLWCFTLCSHHSVMALLTVSCSDRRPGLYVARTELILSADPSLIMFKHLKSSP